MIGKMAKKLLPESWVNELEESKETVIARGRVEKRDKVPAYWIGETPLVLLLGEPLREIAHKREGKTIEIIIRIVGDNSNEKEM